MTTKSKGESVRQKLTLLSKKMGIQYKNIETLFMIERLVARLMTDKTLARHLVFKGGFIGIKNCFEFRSTDLPQSFSY